MILFFKKISLRILTALILVSVLLPLSFVSPVGASAPTAISDTMTRQQTSTLSSHVIVFTESASSQFTAGSTIAFDFGTPGFTLAVGVAADFSFNDGTARTIINAGSGTPTCTAGVNNVTVTTNNGTGVLTVTACSTYTAQAAGSTITFKAGTAAGGTNRLTNPSGTGSKKVAITGTGGFVDVGSFAVPILSPDQVTVTATIDPSITSSLSPTTCPMNATLTSSTTGFCAVTNTVNTNAGTGYTSTVIDYDATNPGKLCSPSVGTCTNSIPASNTTVAQGTSAYGVNTSKSGETVTNTTPSCANNNNQNVTSITGTAKQYSHSTGPVTNDAPILCYEATISGAQAAGAYTEVSTHITTGNF